MVSGTGAFCQGSISRLERCCIGEVPLAAWTTQGEPLHAERQWCIVVSDMRASSAVWQGGTGHAALGLACTRNPGYQVRNVSSHSPFNTRVRIWIRRCAPRLL